MNAEDAKMTGDDVNIGTRDVASHLKQYVSFAAGAEQYAVDIMSVREIKGWTDVTTLPNQPDYVRGVLNLRGAVLPIIDLRCRLGGGHTDTTERHVVVIVAIEGRQIGLLVDAVSDILSVSDTNIQPVPETNSRDEQRVFSGFLTEEDQMVAMLDLHRLLGSELYEDAPADEPLLQ